MLYHNYIVLLVFHRLFVFFGKKWWCIFFSPFDLLIMFVAWAVRDRNWHSLELAIVKRITIWEFVSTDIFAEEDAAVFMSSRVPFPPGQSWHTSPNIVKLNLFVTIFWVEEVLERKFKHLIMIDRIDWTSLLFLPDQIVFVICRFLWISSFNFAFIFNRLFLFHVASKDFRGEVGNFCSLSEVCRLFVESTSCASIHGAPWNHASGLSMT